MKMNISQTLVGIPHPNIVAPTIDESRIVQCFDVARSTAPPTIPRIIRRIMFGGLIKSMLHNPCKI
jgi:hypothetical protein